MLFKPPSSIMMVPVLALFYCCTTFMVSHAFLFDSLDTATCEGRCDDRVDSNHPCQCNVHCQRFNDCCNDYLPQCVDTHTAPPPTGSQVCSSINETIQAMWNGDVNRLSPGHDLTINYQSHVQYGSSTDRAPNNLFSHVNSTKLMSATTVTSFLALLDNYHADDSVSETNSAQESSEINTFLDEVLKTNVMDTLLAYLRCQGTDVTTKSALKTKLQRIWFAFFRRSSRNARDSTSGFEHYIGEFKGYSVVNGFHSWLSFYKKEQAHQLNYLGYNRYRTNPSLIEAVFDWSGRHKTLGTMFIGVSPEFDLAIYTLCYLTHMNQPCPFTLNGANLAIQTYDNGSGHITTAYVIRA